MGMENKTLVYYIISGLFMLLSVYFLPKFFGIYALIIGFAFVYGLTSILNLVLLKKNCGQKPEYKKFLVFSVITVFPTALIGFMLEKMLVSSLGIFLTLMVCSSVMVLFNLLLYLGFGFISVDFIKSKLKARRKSKSFRA